MNREDLIRMAREAGLEEDDSLVLEPEVVWYIGLETLERFATLVAAAERENYDNLFSEIKAWSEAYPVSTFPEPDFKKAHNVLSANGMTLDAIIASNMRHVITQVQNMIDAAIRARGIATSRGQA